MALSILNNLSALTAQNQLSVTQSSLQKALTQLSSGLKINTGADDAAGLSIANGLAANIAALTQSKQNATNGIGLLQTADGALSQVTALLNRATTLATEAANGGLTSGAGSQLEAINTEYQAILGQINNIGTTTNFNGTNVFAGNTTTDMESVQGSLASPLATTTVISNGAKIMITDSLTGGTFVFTGDGTKTIADLTTAVATAATDGTLSAGVTAGIDAATGKLQIKTATAGDSLSVSTTDSNVLGGFNSTNTTGSANVYITDGTASGDSTITTSINSLTTANLTLTGNLSTAANAKTELTNITAAINTVASWRGKIGANINQLNYSSNIMDAQIQNLTTAKSGITDADVASTVADMTKFNILQSTGMAALQQANQAQQSVLKLLQ